MTRRGGRTTRGGRGRQEGRDGETTAANLETTPSSNVNQSQSRNQHDTVSETEQRSGSGQTRAKRGITCGKGARKAMKASKTRLTVEFNFDAKQVVCANASTFMFECGYILRKNCSLKYKEWRRVPENVKAPLRHKLLALFDIDVEDPKVRKVIDSCMAKAWRGYRADLHSYFKEIGGREDLNKAKTLRPLDSDCQVSQEDWEYLCNTWFDPKYQETAQKRIMARRKRKINSRNGSKSTLRYHVERGLDLGSSSGQIETWHLTHWDSEKGWTSTDAAAKYEEMLKLRNENPVESMSDKAIREKVLGRNSVRLGGWGRDPVAGNTTSTTESNRPTYNQLAGRVRHLEETVGTMHKLLIEKNIMPPIVQDDASNNPRSRESHYDESGESGDESGNVD